MEEGTNQAKKSKKGLIISIVVILLIVVLIIAAIFIKDSNGVSYLSKFKNLFIVQDNPDITDKTEDNQKYNLKDYLTIKEKIGNDENFKYQYIEFTSELPESLYKGFLELQEEYMDEAEEQYFVQIELKTMAEIYNDVLFIYAVQTKRIHEMPIIDNINSLYINLENKTDLSNNDIVAMFDYNIEGIMHKVLEHMIENTNTDHYYLADGETAITLNEFKEKIPEYAQKLSNNKLHLVRLYIKNEKLYVGYIESSILAILDLTHDRFKTNETVNSFELTIVNNEEVHTN